MSDELSERRKLKRHVICPTCSMPVEGYMQTSGKTSHLGPLNGGFSIVGECPGRLGDYGDSE